MRAQICGSLAALLAVAPALSLAQPAAPDCVRRYQDFFVRVPVVAVGATDQTRANAEVKSLFGVRPEVCEPGGYQRFLDGFRAYSREAVRAKPKQRDGMIRAAIAILEVAPAHVPAEEGKAAQTAFRQTKSDLAATVADVRVQSPLLDYFLSAFERSGIPDPLPAAGTPGSGAQEGGNVQAVRIPSATMPPWVVVSLYEIMDLQKQKSYDVAQSKLETVLKWLETAP